MADTVLSTSADTRRRVLAIVGASSGNLVEWFDFYIYSFLALYFAPAFFPSGNPTTQLLNTAGVFAAGFLMRPIGGWMFGRIADKHGRRTSMMISVLMMCAGSLVICYLPTYASIGAWAPFFLLIARLFQGLSVGGEYGTSATYMSEVALQGRRGFFASFQYVTLIGGQLAALLVLVVLQQLLTTEELRAWGWRIPFGIGALAAVVSLYLRKSLDETTTAETRKLKEAGTLRGLMQHKGAFLRDWFHGGWIADLLHVYHVHAEVSGEHRRHACQDGQHRDDCGVVHLHDHAARIRCVVGPDWPAQVDDLVRRPRHILHRADPARVEGRLEPGDGVRAGGDCAGYRESLHVDQRTDQGRDVPRRSARAGRGFVVRGGKRGVRRLGGICGAVPEVDRYRVDVLLVRDGTVRDFLDRLAADARFVEGGVLARRAVMVSGN